MSVGDSGWSITQVTPQAGWWVPVVTGVFALAASATAVLSTVLRSRRLRTGLNLLNVVTTTAHAAGHALASCLTGGGVWVIQVHTPDSGVTHFWYPSRLSSIVTSMAGYALPPLAGLGAAALLARGHAPMLLALTVAAVLLILVVTRDWITLASMVSIGVVAGGALYWGPVWLQGLSLLVSGCGRVTIRLKVGISPWRQSDCSCPAWTKAFAAHHGQRPMDLGQPLAPQGDVLPESR